MIAPIISIVLGLSIMQYVPPVAEIILDTFKEYPYLHAPTLNEKKEYVAWFAHNNEGMIVLAQEDEQLCGFITGIPMSAVRDYVPTIDALFQEYGLTLNDYYYCGDVIVLPSHRKQKLCRAMFTMLEDRVKEWGFKGLALITAVRDENHPLKPKDYYDAGLIWEHYGFEKTTIVIDNVQPTVIDERGTVEDRGNSFVFWVKKFK